MSRYCYHAYANSQNPELVWTVTFVSIAIGKPLLQYGQTRNLTSTNFPGADPALGVTSTYRPKTRARSVPVVCQLLHSSWLTPRLCSRSSGIASRLMWSPCRACAAPRVTLGLRATPT